MVMGVKSVVVAALMFGALALNIAAAQAQALVDPSWLEAKLGSETLAVIDIRNRIDGGSAEIFEQAHVPGSVYSNYLTDGWRVTRDGIVAKLPEVDALESLISGLGVSNEDHVVIVAGGVNQTDFGSAARVYWTFKVLGHEDVSILRGGFKAWQEAGGPVASGVPKVEPAGFVANFQPQLLATTADVTDAVSTGDRVLVDGRPLDQFIGNAKHGRAQAAGHIPGAVMRTQFDAFEADGVTLKSEAELASFYGDDIGDGTISYCNTGHWAATNWFMLSEVLGKEDVKLYDGSMVEWTADASRPVAVGNDG